jgi:hypothetical protein
MGVFMSPSRSWVDKLMDKIIGEPGQASQYALICEFCSSHNGLVPPESFARQKFKCFKCDKFNQSQEDRLKNLSQSYMEAESPLKSFNSSNPSNLSDLSNREQISKNEHAKDDVGKENSTTKQNGTIDGAITPPNGAITPPSGGSDVEKKKSASKLRKRTNKKSS